MDGAHEPFRVAESVCPSTTASSAALKDECHPFDVEMRCRHVNHTHELTIDKPASCLYHFGVNTRLARGGCSASSTEGHVAAFEVPVLVVGAEGDPRRPDQELRDPGIDGHSVEHHHRLGAAVQQPNTERRDDSTRREDDPVAPRSDRGNHLVERSSRTSGERAPPHVGAFRYPLKKRGVERLLKLARSDWRISRERCRVLEQLGMCVLVPSLVDNGFDRQVRLGKRNCCRIALSAQAAAHHHGVSQRSTDQLAADQLRLTPAQI
jgi:hypothetical protein